LCPLSGKQTVEILFPDKHPVKILCHVLNTLQTTCHVPDRDTVELFCPAPNRHTAELLCPMP